MKTTLPPDFLIHRIVSIMTNFNAEGATAVRQNRPTHALIYKYEGETLYQSNEKTVVSNASHLIYLPKGSNYRWTCVKSGHCIVVEFDTDLNDCDLIAIDVQSSEKIKSRLQRCETDLLQNSPHQHMEVCRALYDLLLSLLRGVRESEYVPLKKAEKLRPAVEYMTAHSAEKLSNEQLSALVGMSTVYFRKLFAAVYGTSPINYLSQIRIKKAKQILKSDFGSIAEVAASLGYCDVYHFSKAVKKSTGLSPMQYAKKQQTLSQPQ